MAKQRIVAGFPFPVYADETNSRVSITSRAVYINQTSPAAVNVNLAAATATSTAAAFSREVDISFSLIAASSMGAAVAIIPGNSVALTAVSATATAAPFGLGAKHGLLLLIGVG